MFAIIILQMKHTIALLLLVVASHAYAQEQPVDAEGCKDLPMFTRMPNTFITECSENFNQFEIQMTTDDMKMLEGTKAYVSYTYNYESSAKPPSFFQIVRNYENAIKKYSGKKIFYSDAQATLFLKSEGKDVWVVLNNYGGIGEGQFGLTTLTIEPMNQDITANAILDELNAKGSIALYINFETGKSVIQPESQSIIDEIAKMLKEHNTLKVSIEGHTDNVGSAGSNKKLSDERAASVLAALVTGGIEKVRMQSKGLGQEVPIADNRTEDGRAKNRRVEIVKMQ